MSSSLSISPSETITEQNSIVPRKPSTARKYALLVIFCLAQYLDAFNISALFSAIPSLARSLNLTQSEATWIISGTQLTFASFLLVSGRISDIYNPKSAFIVGLFGVGAINLGAGFAKDKIAVIILRTVSGMFASLTIPSALTLITHLFPEPQEQARAIGVFGGSGAMGNMIGLIIGALFVQYSAPDMGWRWVFWFVTLVAFPVATLCFFLIPNHVSGTVQRKYSKFKSLDMVGVSLLTVGLILFIFAMTSSSSAGWGSAMVLAPLIISVAIVAAFFYWETRVPVEIAAVPPKTWFIPNFGVLFGVALLPYLWWVTGFVLLINLWQDVYGWSVISTAVHMLPIGISAFFVSFSGGLSRYTSPKWIILGGQAMLITSTTLLALSDSPSKYWPYVFPAFIIGSSGAMMAYTHTNIAIFRTTDPEIAGTIGAIFNSALQLGSAAGLSVVTSIQTSVNSKAGDPTSYKGIAASFWFLLGIVTLEAISILIFYRVDAERKEGEIKEEVFDEKESSVESA